VSVTVAVLVVIVAASVATIPFVVTTAVLVVIFILAVVVAVVMANFFAIFAGVEVSLPSAMTAPVSVLAAHGERSVIAEARIVSTVNVPAEADRAMEPGTGSEEDSTRKPRGTVIPERGASIGCVVVVAVRADRLDADVDGDLNFGLEGRSREAEKRQKRKREKPQ